MIGRGEVRFRVALATLAVVAGAFAGTESASAGQLRLIYEPTYYSDSDGGGEFKVTSLTGLPGTLPPLGPDVQVTTSSVTGSFQTFCLEFTEHFSSGTLYDYTVATFAVGGGGGAVGGKDDLDPMTAYLYTRFWDGVLSWTPSGGGSKDYDYQLGGGFGGTRPASALALQRAIWFIEQERSLAQIGGTTSDAYQLYLQAYDAVHVSSTWSGLGDVRVLNLTENGIQRQSQLVRLVVVPLPGAGFMGLALLSGFGAVGAWRRRRRALAQGMRAGPRQD